MDNDMLFFFGEHMDALPIYERLENGILSRIPDVNIKVAKTQITFAGRRGFAFVSFNPCRKAKDRPAVWMTVCILKNTTAGKRTKNLWIVATCYGIYCAAWIAYYRGIVTPAVILTLCLAPCLAFGFYSVGRKNCPAQIFLTGFTICHLIYGIVNFL